MANLNISNTNEYVSYDRAKNRKKNKRWPLTANQESLWFIHSLGGGAQSVYNESMTFLLQGHLDIDKLKNSFKIILQQHAVYRSVFKQDSKGNLYQICKDKVDLEMQVTQVENFDQSTINLYVNAQIMKPFDLSNPPLIRIAILQKNETEFMLIIVQHHIITDGISSILLIKELTTNYNKISEENQKVTLVTQYDYLDYVQEEQKLSLSSGYQNKVNKMADHLQGYCGMNFLTTPSQEGRPNIFEGDRVYFNFNKELREQLKTFSKKHKATIFHVLFAAYNLFLNKYTRSEDILIGVPFANRNNEAELNSIGYFANTLPLRIKLNEYHNFLELLNGVRIKTLSYITKQQVNFEHIASKLSLERKAGGQHPLIQTMFVWMQDVARLDLKLNGIDSKLIHDYYPKSSKFDLSLFLSEKNEETVEGYFEFRTDLFDKKTVQKFSEYFAILVQNILNNENASLDTLSMLDDNQLQWMKDKLFTSKLDIPENRSLPQLFSEAAAVHKNSDALVSGSNKYDYATLDSISNKWASYLRLKYRTLYKCEMPADTLIGICLDRCEEMIFAILGILKSGAAYVPIDPRYPKDRIDYMLADSNVALLLTHHDYDELFSQINPDLTIHVDESVTQQQILQQDESLNHVVSPKDLAYVLYTSGSTGKPKGVLVTHENIICLFESLKKIFIFSCEDVWSLFHTYCFDISVWEIWGALLFGGKLIVVPYDVSRDPREFRELILAQKVTVLTQTSSAFQMLIDEDLKYNKKLDHLRYIAFVGESLKVSILQPWVDKYGCQFPKLVNMYGITETTVYTNYKFVDQDDIDKGRDNIGFPLEQFSMCIMDDQLQWCPLSVVGEIYIGGRGLSRGYLNRDDLTAQKFIIDPYASYLNIDKKSLLYRTGDLGRWLEDGSIEYLGRKDFQIKLRGFRIELGEIEAALGSYPEISHATVLLKGEGEKAHLAAYYTTKLNCKVELPRLIAYLKSFLPEYMIPKCFILLASIPMTTNGKIDRALLSTLRDVTVTEQKDNHLNTQLERLIAGIWSTLLNIEIKQIGPHSNFFELGGNSLMAVKMIALVGNKIKQELSISQFMGIPNIVALTSQIENKNNYHENIRSHLKRLNDDLMLNEKIQPIDESNQYIYSPKNILLTGSSGFLGAHILHEMIHATQAMIYCLVRAPSREQALAKVCKKSVKYGLEIHKNLDRIVIVLGDLSKQKLGISVGELNLLSKEIDALYHVGAQVHHIYDYYSLYNSNVRPTLDLLDLATLHKNKSIHFISTFGTQFISPIEKLPKLEQGSYEALLNLNGYLSTKWICEQILEEAVRRGIKAHIYRPGNIVLGTFGVDEPENNHILLRLKGMLQLGKAYIKQDEILEMTPVDLLAQAIVRLSNDPKQFAYNLHNHINITWRQYLEYAKNMGHKIEFLQNQAKWQTIINNLDESNALYKLKFLYQQTNSKYQESSKVYDICSDYPFEVISYEQLVRRQLIGLIKSGFIE